jgi:DNA repair protein RecO (recombination protein O)
MGIHTAEAIVLRCYPYRETSVIVTCLTDRYGKLKGLVKGLRSHPNRHRSAMEPLTVNRIVFYDTNTSQLHLMSQCDLLTPWTELQRDLETAKLGGFFAELVDAVVPLEEPQSATYQLLKHALERLALAAGDMRAARIHFIVRLLRLAGFQPQLDECTSCAKAVHTAGYWSARQGGLLCPSCLHHDPHAEAAIPEMLEALEELSEVDQPHSLHALLLQGLNRRLDEFLHWRIDHPLKTLEAPGSRFKVKRTPAYSLQPRA